MKINGEIDIEDRIVIKSKYIELIELIHSIEPGKGRRIFPEEGENMSVMRTVCYALSASSRSYSYKKHRMKDRITTVSSGEEDGMPYLDVYVLKGEES